MFVYLLDDNDSDHETQIGALQTTRINKGIICTLDNPKKWKP